MSTQLAHVNKYMAARFPDSFYLVAKTNNFDYMNRVTYGFSKMAESTVVIGILARDVADILPYNLYRLEFLKSLFKDANLIAYENDSVDKTCQILLSSMVVDDVISESGKFPTMEQDKSLQRREKMAYCRNRLRDAMIEHGADYYLLYDADILGGFSYEGIANSFSYKWDVCGSNSIIYDGDDENIRRLYYDSWAWRDIENYEDHDSEDINLRSYNRGDKPVECMSCFGGLAIYNNIFTHKQYRYTSEDCDHVTINIPMYDNGAKIIMNPSQLVLYNKTRYVV